MITINYQGERFELIASRYTESDTMALALCPDSTGEPTFFATIDVPGTHMKDQDYDIILNTNNSDELLAEVFKTGLIAEEPYGYAQSGFRAYPIHSMTQKGIEWIDGQNYW